MLSKYRVRYACTVVSVCVAILGMAVGYILYNKYRRRPEPVNLFQYHTPPDSGVHLLGQHFHENLTSLMYTVPHRFISLDTYNMNNFTFVTGANKYHFWKSVDGIAGFQKVFPNHTIIYYDLGLSPDMVRKIKTWCQVQYREFNFSRYPEHIRNLHSYGFKGIIYYEALKEFDAIMWVDTTIRPNMNDTNWHQVFDTARGSGVVEFVRSGRDAFQCTTPGMYDYLPTDQKKLRQFEMYGSGCTLMYKTADVYWKILHWFYLCSLTPQCIIPTGHKLRCPLRSVPGAPRCHRYDQSILSILIGNMLSYNQSRYIPRDNHVIRVKRGPSYRYDSLRICQV